LLGSLLMLLSWVTVTVPPKGAEVVFRV
jgi:hypothetical protein